MTRAGALSLVVLLMLRSSLGGRVAPPARPEKGKPPGPAAAKVSPRLTKLKALPFDRRPSAILKAWAPQPPPEPKDKKAKPDPLDLELKALQRHVTLGNWPAVKSYLAGLPADEGKAAYQHLLTALQRGPMPGAMRLMPPGMSPDMPPDMLVEMHPDMPPGGGGGPMMQYAERNRFSPDDVVGLAAAAPTGLDKEALNALGGILGQCLAGGTVVEAVLARLKTEVTRDALHALGGALGPSAGTFGGVAAWLRAEGARRTAAALNARQAARLLAAAGQAAEAGAFLPPLDQAKKDGDLEALNLLARHLLGRYGQDSKLTHLEKAWGATQAALALPPDARSRAEQEEALRRAVELAPKLKEEMGLAWLEQSFTTRPERGMSILATIGALSAQGLQMQAHNPDSRLKTLKLQKTAVEALLKASPARAREWRDTVTLLAVNWLKEAEFTYRFAPDAQAQLRRDRFGNMYFWDNPWGMGPQPQNPNQPKPIATVDTLAARPAEAWLGQVRADLRPKLAMTLCQLHLKADEERAAFPHIEQLARSHPKKARELANEFLRVWTRTHDPNDQRRNTNRYMYMFGFEQRADGIPLTRSKQERNLSDLAAWVARLQKLPIGEVDEALLAKAFTACHSSAEVYRSEAIEKVFGPIKGLKPKTLAGLAQQMRENLAGVWRRPEEQKDKKTNRKTKDIQAEVRRGYAVGLATVDSALKKFPDDWSLVLARAAILHDEVGFLAELSKSTSFAPKRQQAYAEFARAAKLYAARVQHLPEEEQSTKVFEQWFYASLGARDLEQVNEEKVPDLRQPAAVRQALLALPGETAEKHRTKFANALFTRLSAVKPAVKFRYLKAGFEIAGDHKDAAEAKKVFDYYKDIVSEIKLVAKVDGPAVVGHRGPFGVFVSLEHTREIERESGGFGRYLQNQNTNTMFSWNYGRPTADYRDRFQGAATEALKEHFEVLSVTFETDKVHSRAAREYGWRVTPYAYLLLKPRGPQVDKLPPLRIDLDFLDTSGYVVLPIESAAVPLDARPARGEPRPARKLEVTQILDERQAAQGQLRLEVKVTAQGLVPELERVLALAPDGFEVVKTDDQGVSVSRFHPDSDTITIQSERTWLVTLQAREGAPAPPTFRFGTAKVEDAKMVYQRYDDADLATVGAEVTLERHYGRRNYRWAWWAGGGAAGVLGLAVVLLRRLRRGKTAEAGRWKLPEPLTPFTALRLLERIGQEGQLDEGQRAELVESIRRVERHYFAGNGNGDGQLDLKEVAEGWVRRVR